METTQIAVDRARILQKTICDIEKTVWFIYIYICIRRVGLHI
jgi:hypothetical protein